MWVLEIKLKPSGRAGSTLWLLAHLYSPTKNTVKLFLGDGPSTDYQEICHMKKKTVEFNLNIPESPTEHLQQRRLDQMSTNIQALMKEHAESYPYRDEAGTKPVLYEWCLTAWPWLARMPSRALTQSKAHKQRHPGVCSHDSLACNSEPRVLNSPAWKHLYFTIFPKLRSLINVNILLGVSVWLV